MAQQSTYVPKEGTGNIFKNENAEGSQPQYRGNFMWKGELVDIALWVSKSQSGKSYFSAKVQEPYKPKEEKKIEKPKGSDGFDLDDDDLPF